MLSKIFKKTETPPAPVQASKQPVAPSPEQIAAQVADKAAWESKLQAALGDDAALLAIANDSPLIDIKHAAVEALASEEALKRAEREFRDHDRRVHRAAKQRHESMVNRRLAAVSVAKLMETAAVLLHEPSIPANRLVELDRAWAALDQTLLDEKQQADYLALWTKLSALTRERGEQQLQARRWLADAEPALSQLTSRCADVVEVVDVVDGMAERAMLAEARAKVDAVLATAPATQANAHAQAQAIEAKSAELQRALQLATDIDTRLALLEEFQQPLPLPVTESVVVEKTDAAPETAAPKPPSPASRWRALAPVADARIAAALDARFAQWQSAKSDARQARTVEARQHAKEESKAVKQARNDALAVIVTDLVAKAETALADGHLAESTKFLTAIDEACANAKGAALEKTLQTRIETLQAETARLKGWQHWSGGRVREDLVLEAEALAKASSAEKVAVKQHADAIENLRNRWKELDKLGGATSRPLWQKFDAALKTAYQPVAVHLAKLKAVRQENLAARNSLLGTLDAVKIADAAAEVPPTAPAESAPPVATPETAPDAAPATASGTSSATAPDWRALARALDHFQTEWRKCGPVEHTVPHKAQAALAARMKASVARIDAPLTAARQRAQTEREQLIARAKALATDIRNREVIAKVRQLQTEWQAHAKTLPLMRQVENALWTEFKSATDAVFTQRDALHATRDAEFKANQATRETLIARLAALAADTPATEIKRSLAEADGEWRKCGEAPRAAAAKLESQFRAARDAAQQFLAGSAKRGWHNICDTLAAKLVVCVEAEAGASADIGERWTALPPLPSVWEKALGARFTNAQSGIAADFDTDEAFDEIATQLLQLESALEIESLPAFQAARRDLKLRAMKAAIEGRQSAATTNADIERWLAEVLAQSNVDAVTHARVATIVAALRNKPLR